MMKNMVLVCFCMVVFSPLLISMPAFGAGGEDIKNGHPAIVKVHGEPVGVGSKFRHGNCQIRTGVLPMDFVKVEPGKSLVIKVVGDDDIVILCNGEKGITISRD